MNTQDSPRPAIAKVYLFQNGLVMAFDNLGLEQKDFCGWRGDVREKILKASDEKTKFFEVATVGSATSAHPLENF